MDISDFETLLDAKINPLIETIKRLEQSQEKIVEVMMAQARMNENLMHLQKAIDDHLNNSKSAHDELFKRVRDTEKNSECKNIRKELSDRIEDLKSKGEDKLWDVVKMVLSGIFGGLIIWLFRK